VPGNDPTLLFTNAGMVQFKDVFLGPGQARLQRAPPPRRSCVRAGGKHNDLENVGYTARHHTFFEMLGNFSFGDYFKRRRDRLRLGAAHRRSTGCRRTSSAVTVYAEDDEAVDIWCKKIGVPAGAHRPHRRQQVRDAPTISGRWATPGPAVRAREIFYDHGARDLRRPARQSPDEDGDRYIEIWNLVFMQFDRDGRRHAARRCRSPRVDTGMGLERFAAVLQGVHDNYDIDLFQRPDPGGRGARPATRRTLAQPFAARDRRPHPRLRLPDRRRRACPATRAAATCCAASSAAPCATATSWAQTQPFFHPTGGRRSVRAMGAAYPELRARRRPA
jgi:alanyl-tRNA synthetase